jgi:predicted hydrocarbon binding protein
MMRPDEVQPRARNFYNEEDYFSLNVRNGILRSPTGTRMLALPEEMILGLHAGLEDETGAAAPVILYQCGRWWGRQWVRRHGAEIRQFYSTDAGELPLAFYLQVLRRVWALCGWGRIELSFDLRNEGFLECSLQHGFYSEIVGNIGRTTDDLVAGVLSAILSDISGRDLECLEIACRSKGDLRCHFLAGIKPRVGVVREWVKQGRSRAQIVEAIAQGDILLPEGP